MRVDFLYRTFDFNFLILSIVYSIYMFNRCICYSWSSPLSIAIIKSGKFEPFLYGAILTFSVKKTYLKLNFSVIISSNTNASFC